MFDVFCSLSDTSVRLELCSVRFTRKIELATACRLHTVQECPDPRPEGLVTSVAQLGVYTCII